MMKKINVLMFLDRGARSLAVNHHQKQWSVMALLSLKRMEKIQGQLQKLLGLILNITPQVP